MVYQLTYELKTPDRDYSILYEFLEQGLGNGVHAKHVLRDCWWFSTSQVLNVDEVCENIRKRMGELDNLYMSRIPDSDINGWLPSSIWKWYEDNKN